MEIGRGDYCYVRSAWDGSPHVVFRFSTPTEAHAATAKGMELDHIKGAPPELVHAVMRAARAALE